MERKEAGMWRSKTTELCVQCSTEHAEFPLGEVQRLRSKAPSFRENQLVPQDSGIRSLSPGSQIMSTGLRALKSAEIDRKVAKICTAELEQFHIDFFYHILKSLSLSRL